MMLSEKEKKLLNKILKEGEKREKRWYYQYFVTGILILIAIPFFTIGFIFKANEMIILGLFMVGIGLGSIPEFQSKKILYNIIKKMSDQYLSNEISFNNRNDEFGWGGKLIGIYLILGGLLMAFRDELMYLSTGVEYFLRRDPFDIPFKIIGFTLATIGFLIIIITIIRRRK